MEFETGQRDLQFYPHNRRITEGEPKENRRVHNYGIRFWNFTECSRKCLWKGHTFVERLVCLAGSYVRLKNIWPSKPRDNRSGTEGKLHGIFESGIQAVWLGSRGSAGVAVWEPRTWRQSQTRKRIWKQCSFENTSITEGEPKGN